MKIEVSNGEILDKLSILDLKLEYITDIDKKNNIKKEFEVVKACADNIDIPYEIYDKLYSVNKKLWEIEDAIRLKEKALVFDGEFIELARQVYKTNDERSRIKKEINLLTNSEVIEEKSYK